MPAFLAGAGISIEQGARLAGRGIPRARGSGNYSPFFFLRLRPLLLNLPIGIHRYHKTVRGKKGRGMVVWLDGLARFISCS